MIIAEGAPWRFVSTDHYSNRKSRRIDHIVIHYTASRNIEGTIAHFRAGTPRVSAHYIVGRDGEIVQMVKDDKAAWHAGNAGMNARSIGIEHVAADGDRITDAQSKASIALIRALMTKHGIQAESIIPHSAIKPTSCCGDLLASYGKDHKMAVQAWLHANGIGGDPSSVKIAISG